jgi:polyisoprenoid-binding protein YceI
MARLRIGIFAILLLIFTIACGSTSTVSTTTSGSSSNTSSSVANVSSTAAAASDSTPLTAVATTDSSAATPAPPAGSVTYTLVADQSQASYKATEQLVGISSPSDAIGKTSQVSGQMVFDSTGAVVSSASKITIDLSTLTSDKSQRDNYIKHSTLDTQQYPDAVFVPTSVQGLTWPLPTSGSANVTIVGNLTAHGVTKQTTWTGRVTFSGTQVKGTATTTVKFEDFGMTPPRTMLVLSVQDHLTFELDFVFTPAK